MQPTQTNLLRYDGATGQLYGVWLKNLLFLILTLGIYRAWARTRIRRYVWSSFSIGGDRLEYTGTGGELFRGYVKIALILFGLSMVVLATTLLSGGDIKATTDKVNATDVVTWAFFAYLYYFGAFSALRYRLTRTRWRGIRGSLTGHGFDYVLFRVKRSIINIATLGYCIGRSDILNTHYLAERVSLGSQRCSYSCEIHALDGVNLRTLLLCIPTLGISRYWYRAAFLNAKYNNLRAGDIYFQANFTGGTLLRLSLGNLLILICTFFIGVPIIIQRLMRVFAAHVQIIGSLEGSTVTQITAQAGNIGEGIDDYMSYDGLDFDIGIL